MCQRVARMCSASRFEPRAGGRIQGGAARLGLAAWSVRAGEGTPGGVAWLGAYALSPALEVPRKRGVAQLLRARWKACAALTLGFWQYIANL